MTREEALESGIRKVWRHLVASSVSDLHTPEWAARDVLCILGDEWNPDEVDGVAVGLQMVAVEVAEIARKRREVEATSEAPESQRESTAQAPVVPKVEAFTYERVEVAGPAGDPIWTYERRREAE